MNSGNPRQVTIWAERVLTEPGSPLQEGAAVRIDGERIAEIETRPPRPSDRVYQKATLLPGLFDLHLHLGIELDPDDPLHRKETPPVLAIRCAKNAAITLSSGVTTCRDAGTRDRVMAALREAAEKGLVNAPRLLIVCRPLGAPEGHCNYMTADIRTEAEARAAVRAEVGAGADWIKLMVTGGVVPPSRGTQLTAQAVRAAVDEAHRQGVYVMAHSETVEGNRMCVEAGVDTIEHGVAIDDPTLEQMAARGTTLVPTLMAFYEIVQRHNPALPQSTVDLARAAYEKDVELVGRARGAGVRLAAGTDGSHGSIALELELLARAGLTHAESLHAATAAAAQAVHMEDRLGRLKPGYLADLLLVEGDPLADLGAIRQVRAVWLGGKLVHERTANRVVAPA